MHKINHPSFYCHECPVRMLDLRLTSSLIDLLGLDILGINNLFIWKAPEIGLGFPWHQDKYYFRRRYMDRMDTADQENGCLHVLPG